MKILMSVIALVAGVASHAAVAAPPMPRLYSAHAVVYDADNQETLLEKNAGTAVPFASITKLLTAMVALDADPDMNEMLSVSEHDVDMLKHTSSRIAVGTTLSREDMKHLALMSSENRLASALSRKDKIHLAFMSAENRLASALSQQYPGGHGAFIAAMNAKAAQLGMVNTHVEDPTGLSPNNRASAQDLVHMVLAAERYEPIRQFTTSTGYLLPVASRTLAYHNTNRLVGNPDWNIELSKTGYTSEAGRCIVMKLEAAGKHLVVVLLGAPSSNARFADLFSIRRWITGEPAQPVLVAAHRPRRSRNIMTVSATQRDIGRHALKKSMRLTKYQIRKSKAKALRV